MSKVCLRCGEEKPHTEFFKKSVIRKKVKTIIAKPNCMPCDLEIQRIYRKNNKIRLATRDAKYYQENKEHKLKIGREYLLKNKEKRNQYIREYKRKKRLNDPNFRIYENTRKRIWKSLKNKSNSSKELLGCPINFYKMWLEYTFTETMNWDNYGILWHIDHVIPIVSFDLTDINAQKKAFSWLNTRAMLGPDNLKKKIKLLET